MKAINTNIRKLGILTLGQQNDGAVTQVRIDLREHREMYPELTYYSIAVTNPDKVTYIADTVIEEDALVWNVTGADTAVVGKGLYQVLATGDNGALWHSAKHETWIIDNMEGIADAGEAPAPHEPWYQSVIEAAEAVVDSLDKMPVIGDNGNWYLYNNRTGRYEDSGSPSKGEGNGGAVQSVNGKTGAVKLTAEDVGALPKDTPIPDPYTLPTASETVKGGVKVGNGLQMNGEVLEVVSEGVFELIEKIILEEDSTLIRNQEPDGTPYRLKAIMIKGKTKKNFSQLRRSNSMFV